MKKLILLIAIVFSMTGKSQCNGTGCNPGCFVPTPYLQINNNRNCDVTVNYEVSNCEIIGIIYCNSTAQFATNSGTFVIPANSTFTVDVSLQFIAAGASDCTWYGGGQTYDINVNLFEINYVGVSSVVYGGVSNGCNPPFNCFGSTTTAFGDATNPPAAPSSCSTAPNAWSMQWSLLAFGVTVDIN